MMCVLIGTVFFLGVFVSSNAHPWTHSQNKNIQYGFKYDPKFHRHHQEFSHKKNSTLELVHVIFRHGNRNPDVGNIYPGSFYQEKHYPEGYGQLTNAGKRKEYNLGLELRNRYGDFLGRTWNIKHLEARSTDFNRTKMSLELVLAGLYPPIGNQAWSPIYWQPIPYNYVPKSQDKEIWPFAACPDYKRMMQDLYRSPEISRYLERYNETFAIMEKRTIKKMDVQQAFFFYFGYVTKNELGYPLDEWTKSVYPEPLHSIAVDMYYLMTNTTALRRTVSGYFIKKVLADTKAKMEGTLDPQERKMFIYSAHETNIATTLLSLDALKVSQIPPYGSYILFEVHNINNVHGIKIFYQNCEQQDPVPIKINGCDYFCPYEKFYNLVEKILPENDEDCFGSTQIA